MDEVRLWRTARTQAEILEHMRDSTGLDNHPVGLVAVGVAVFDWLRGPGGGLGVEVACWLVESGGCTRWQLVGWTFRPTQSKCQAVQVLRLGVCGAGGCQGVLPGGVGCCDGRVGCGSVRLSP